MKASRQPTVNRAWLVVAVFSVLVLAASVVPLRLWLEPGVPTMVAGMAFAAVGALLAVRRPANAIGGLLVAMGAVWAMGEAAFTYLAGVAAEALPDSDLISWLNVWGFYLMLPLVVAVVAMFPTGRVVTGWMQWTLRAAVTVAVLDVAARMVVPIAPDQSPFGEEFVGNPWSVEALAPLAPMVQVLDYIQVALIVLAVADLVSRWRRSGGVERLQMRWFALGLMVFSFLLVAAMALEAAGVTGNANDVAWDLGAWVIGLGSIPIAIGVAITRYRLYDIDRLISRTVSYALVVGVLAAVFVAIAVGIPQLVRLPGESPLWVAGATLAIAALFNPMRRRVQATVDRRFNRARYDAQREVDWFAGQLRDQVDLDDLTGDLTSVLAKTLQPSCASIWIGSGP